MRARISQAGIPGLATKLLWTVGRTDGVRDVLCKCRKRALAADLGSDCETNKRKHSQSAVLDFLQLQFCQVAGYNGSKDATRVAENSMQPTSAHYSQGATVAFHQHLVARPTRCEAHSKGSYLTLLLSKCHCLAQAMPPWSI